MYLVLKRSEIIIQNFYITMQHTCGLKIDGIKKDGMYPRILTVNEAKAVEAAADDADKSTSEFIREIILKHLSLQEGPSE